MSCPTTTTAAMTTTEDDERRGDRRRNAARSFGAVASLILLSACASTLVSHRKTLSSSSSVSSSSLRYRRSLSVALPHGGCRVTPATGVHHDIVPVFTASYPGSGAKMTWNLIEALTGLVTGDEWESNGHRLGKAVTVKSHYPHKEGNAQYMENIGPGPNSAVPRAIVLLRNPQNALPSYLNFLYEVNNDLEGHSTRAPPEEWLAWRDHEFDEEIRRWKDHTEYWLDRYGPEQRLVLSYEGLTDDVGGPIFAGQLAEFLNRKDGGVPTIYRDSVPCVWETVIKYKGEAPVARTGKHLSDSDPANPVSRRKGKKMYPYTPQQYDRMIEVIMQLRGRYGDQVLHSILDSYVNAINGVKASIEKPAPPPPPKRYLQPEDGDLWEYKFIKTVVAPH